MEVRIYDADMNFCGLVEDQTSVLWNRAYFGGGSFELYCPVTPNNQGLLQMWRLVWLRGAVEAGVIESLTIEQNAVHNQITAKGRFLDSYMTRRLIRPMYEINNGLVETAMRDILTNAAPIPLVQLDSVQGFPETVTFQATYKNLFDYEQRLSKYANIGFRFKPDFTNKTITFELYKGLDRTMLQSDRNRVVFSQAYNNIAEAKYSVNSQLLKNVCYVGGRGTGSQREYVIAGDDTVTGLDRYEVYINGSDISDEGLTDAEYHAMLEQRGNNELQHDVLCASFECVTDANRNFIYKENYDLGDIVTIQKENWGLSTDLRLTEIAEVYEYGAMRVQPTFGTPLPATIDWSEADG